MPKLEKEENRYTSTTITPKQYATYGSRRIDRNSDRSRDRDFQVSTIRNTPSSDDTAATRLLASIGNGRYKTVVNAIGVLAGFDMLNAVKTEPASWVRPSAFASCALTVSWLNDGTPKKSAVDVARYEPTARRIPKRMMRISDAFATSPRDLPTSPASAMPQNIVRATCGRSRVTPYMPAATSSTPFPMLPVRTRATPYEPTPRQRIAQPSLPSDDGQ
jgi:hypothetical protein